jgi:TRAP-type transport system periplasmic protein
LARDCARIDPDNSNPGDKLMKKLALFSSIAVALSLVGASGAVLAQAKVELRYSSGAPPTGNPWVMQINRFAKDVEEESKGEIKIQPFLSSQLGSEQDTVQQVARGRIDMGGSAALLVPELGLVVMPFYFKNNEELDCVLDNHLTKPIADLYAKKGVQFLGWTEVGTIDFFGKKAYANPKDLAGVKAISYANKTQALFYAAMSANANPMGLPEWIPAMQTGLAEVVMTTITSALPMGLTKVATTATRASLYDSPGLTLMNKAVYDKLSPQHREALLRAQARHASSVYRAEVRGFENTLYGMHEKAGGQIATMTPDQRVAWRKQLESVYPQIVKETGGESDKFFAVMEAGRKACAK